jgi:hypothetical protein
MIGPGECPMRFARKRRNPFSGGRLGENALAPVGHFRTFSEADLFGMEKGEFHDIRGPGGAPWSVEVMRKWFSKPAIDKEEGDASKADSLDGTDPVISACGRSSP